MHRIPARAALLGAALCCAAPCQQVIAPVAATHGAIVADKDGLVLPAGEFTVVELVEATAAFLCRNYLYDFELVQGRGVFSLQRRIAVDAPGSEELLAALLATRGLAALPIDELRGIWQVVDTNDPHTLAALPWRTPEEILRRPHLREPAVTALDLQHVSAQVLMQTLRQHAVRAGGREPSLFGAFAADDRLLLLRGYRDQLADVVQLVQQLERVSTAPTAADDEALQARVERLERELAELRALVARRDGAGR